MASSGDHKNQSSKKCQVAGDEKNFLRNVSDYSKQLMPSDELQILHTFKARVFQVH